MLRKYLIGLFIFLFFISSGALILVTIDDQHDLSTRAGGILADVKRVPLERLKEDVKLDTLEIGQTSITYDSTVWSKVKGEDNLIINNDKHITLRVLPGDLDNGVILKTYLDKTAKQKSTQKQVAGTSYVYDVLGSNSYVDIWKIGSQRFSLKHF